MPETNRFEYKRELNDRLERAVVSFLNYSGNSAKLFPHRLPLEPSQAISVSKSQNAKERKR
jgi:hypothetical protein